MIKTSTVCAIICTLALGVTAGENPKKVEPVLEADAALLKKIADLAPNTWMKLPRIKVAGDLDWLPRMNWKSMGQRGPYGRDFSNKAAWMPDRKRAIYAGGGHNVRPLNDVWEYDLASNTWVCLYGADTPAQNRPPEWVKENLVIKDGVLQTKRSGPPRLSHTFDGWSYDSHRRVAFLPESLRGAVFVKAGAVAKGLGLTDAELRAQWKAGPYIWTFDPYARKWKALTENVPKCGRDPSARYLAHSKTYWLSSSTFGIYDPDKKTQLPANKTGRGGGYASSTVYDPDTRSVVVTKGGNTKKGTKARTWVYSCDKNEWKLTQDNAPVAGRSSSCYFDYSTRAKLCLMFVGGKLWSYDVTGNKWAEVAAKGEKPKGSYMIGYYDVARDVLVHYSNGNMWCIRVAKD